MKKYILSAIAIATGLTSFISCSEDNLRSESVITIDQEEQTDFDKWLTSNYINTYNIGFLYRFQDIETDHDYFLIPADYKQSIKLAHIVKYCCLEAFDEVAGIDFTRANFPKQVYLVGNWEFKNNGTFVLGTAEGGKKIFLAGVNELDKHLDEGIGSLNHYYLKTIFHEFTHILNQTIDYSADFKLITPTSYVADNWSKKPYNVSPYCYEHGFISSYAQHSDVEDFAELFSIYVTNTEATWNSYLAQAGNDGAGIITSKLALVKEYMQKSWGIDMDKLRSTVLRREADVANGKIDLNDLTINK